MLPLINEVNQNFIVTFPLSLQGRSGKLCFQRSQELSVYREMIACVILDCATNVQGLEVTSS